MSKPLLLFLFTVLVLSSCEKEEPTPEVQVEGEWGLVRSEGGFEGSVQEGEDLDWNESYAFDSDNSFSKVREDDGEVFQASGTYSVTEADIASSANVKYYLELTFETGDDIVGDCYGDGRENLVITHGGQLRNTWGECDGPILYYDKK